VGREEKVLLVRGSVAQEIYGNAEAVEIFACNYGLNEEFTQQIASRDLKISGYDADGTVRIAELPGHPFYIATLFVPQMNSTPDKPHPLIVAFLRAAASR
jgi:CTP synthase (UTP-ammonia lyase)